MFHVGAMFSPGIVYKKDFDTILPLTLDRHFRSLLSWQPHIWVFLVILITCVKFHVSKMFHYRNTDKSMLLPKSDFTVTSKVCCHGNHVFL